MSMSAACFESARAAPEHGRDLRATAAAAPSPPSPMQRARSATRIIRLSDDGLTGAREQLNELFALLEARGGNGDVREARLDLRYVGQEHTLTVSLPAADGAHELRERFDRDYDRMFGHA